MLKDVSSESKAKDATYEVLEEYSYMIHTNTCMKHIDELCLMMLNKMVCEEERLNSPYKVDLAQLHSHINRGIAT